jgi:hypothetical protein
MRFIKPFGIAAMAATAAIMLIGTATAEADSEIVLCKSLVEQPKLCPAGAYWPQGTRLVALAKGVKVVTSIGTIECEDGIIEAGLGTEMGKILNVTIDKIELGKLPTPKLGEGCSVCTKGIHATVPTGATFEVFEPDHFFFTTEIKFVAKGCPLGATCEYTTGESKSFIDPDSVEHPDFPGVKKDLILIRTTLTRIGGGLCPATAELTADFIPTLATFKEETHLWWLALEQL